MKYLVTVYVRTIGDPGYVGPQGEIGQKGGFVVLKVISLRAV